MAEEGVRARLAGHTLPMEGRVLTYKRWGSGPGHGRCSCGEKSPDSLPSTAARQRWHRDHKQAVREASRG